MSPPVNDSDNAARPMGKRVGIMGGSFDPVHNGHLIIAVDALEQCALDHVLWVPAAAAPLRESGPVAAAAARLEMVRLAIDGIPAFSVDRCEVDRGGTSYAWDTATALQQRQSGARLYWIIGADQLSRLPAWHRIDDLAGVVDFIVANRPNCPVDQSVAATNLRLHHLRSRSVGVSSSEIRQRLASGQTIAPFVPTAVKDYIFHHHLYIKTQ